MSVYVVLTVPYQHQLQSPGHDHIISLVEPGKCVCVRTCIHSAAETLYKFFLVSTTVLLGDIA